MEKKLFDILKERGYVKDLTHEKEIINLINGEPMTFYLGIDPTADSLHIGHFFALTMFRWLQDFGHHGIILIGGATALIGDPTGKSDMRKMLSKEEVAHNKAEVKELVKRFVKTDGENPAIIVDNADWICDKTYVDFMRDIGVHFNVNNMLAADCYKKRLENGGLTFLEMGYMLMQAYDFVYLNRKYGCRLEFGGSDQWANILAGADLGRKLSIMEGKDAETFQAFTNVLLLNADGVKMGKTEKGAVWVDKNKFSPYDFYQYFYNCDDRDVEKLFKILTYLPLDKISEIMKGDIREAKRIMAYEITKLVHGEDEAKLALETAQKLFGSQQNIDNAPSYELIGFNGEISITELCEKAKVVATRSEARRAIEQGGLSLNNNKVTNVNYIVTNKDFVDNALLIKKGKKTFMKVVLK